jgi:hypothetical protein
MRRVLWLLPVILTAACSSVAPNAGEEAVLIHKPMLFGHGGVNDAPVRTGRAYVAWTTDHVIVNMQPVAFQQAFDDMNSSDGVPLDFNAQMTLVVTDSVRMVRQFGSDLRLVYSNNIAKEFESLTRKAVRNHAEAQIATTAIDQIDNDVEQGIRAHLKMIGIPFALREITVGKANPPDSIEAQRIETAAQRQRKNTETERNLAEIARKTAEESRASADRAYNDNIGITETQNVELKKTQMISDACAKGGCTFIMGGSGITPLLQLK